MESLRELYKVGRGPSSSHTMGPERICKEVLNNYDGDSYQVTLYGSLSFTGLGHLTDKIIKETLPNTEVIFSKELKLEHPNTMDVVIYKNNEIIGKERYYSTGGGSILRKGDEEKPKVHVYPHNNFQEIKDYCVINDLTLYDYVYKFEDPDFKDYLREIWKVMKNTINQGLHQEGYLPGLLEVKRKAKSLLYDQKNKVSIELRLLSAYAYATSEVNASGGTVVTAPTCGASGVLPSLLYFLKDIRKYSDERIIDGLATAGIIGNIIKHNASISGAEAGCQAEVGTACAMAAAAYSELENGKLETIEYAAEIALEHHLGLTCDPISGYVQIPCIERNAVAAVRAMNAGELATLLIETRLVSFDTVVEAMKETGKDLLESYKETSIGGLAKFYKKKVS
ncbi:MAG: L-serine ammonia-lyase, iron-sulfur-dependent, subunit alpha [Candidatus Izemoplasmatales bacterium]|nr:L-serine ammonia-lyase, iron-sulfur-dependent, subunit alpha [Candidatus Izemoplasmatales bacterium]